jgi:hypothetical protein
VRLHGTLYADQEGTVTIQAWARDADNEDRLTRVELRVRGNQITLVPDERPVEVEITSPESGKLPVPDERRVPLDGSDFALR